MVRRRDGHGVCHDDTSLIPSRGHGAAEGVKESLGFPCDALSATGLALVGLCNGIGLAGLQGAGVKRMNGRLGVGERGAIRGVEGRGEGEDLEGLDARDGHDVVVVGLGLFWVGGGVGGGVDGDEVGDGAGCKEGSLNGGDCWLGGGDSDAVDDAISVCLL